MTINPRDVVQQSNQAKAQVASSKAQIDLAAFNAYENALAAAAQSQNALKYTNLIADSSGVISSIAVESGQVVSTVQTVATLVQTSELEVAVAHDNINLAIKNRNSYMT